MLYFAIGFVIGIATPFIIAHIADCIEARHWEKHTKGD